MEDNELKQLQKYGYTESKLYPDYQLARVIAQYRGKYKVITDQQEFFAEISGKFRYTTEELVQFPTVGDFVMVTVEKEFASIHQVLTRKSLFLRKAVGVSNQSQTVAANIDTVFLCMSLNKNFNLNRMERYLSIAWDSGATPVIVLTKSDLCEDLSERISQIESISCFSDIIVISYFSKNQTCAFIGSSGVGKSTLINRLLGVNTIATQEIAKGDKGRHTTTGREMFLCPLGGVVIDTPGMREMGADSTDLSKTFSELESLAYQCKFRNCTHTNEPGCAVLAAIERGELDIRRLENYRKLQHESSYDGLNSKEIEIKKCERMFKDVGGMKNVRRYAKEQRKRK